MSGLNFNLILCKPPERTPLILDLAIVTDGLIKFQFFETGKERSLYIFTNE